MKNTGQYRIEYYPRLIYPFHVIIFIGAVKALYLLIFGKPRTSSSLDFVVSVQVADRTPSALEMALRIAERQGYGLLEAPHIFNYYDYGSGSDLHVILSGMNLFI